MSRAVVITVIYAIVGALGVVALSACSDPYEESGPPDEVAIGSLCVPATNSCPASAVLHRDSDLGANRLDFAVHNRGDTAEITVEALPTSTTDQGDTAPVDSDDAEVEPVSQGPLFISRSYVLRDGESTTDRFVQEELFTRKSFRLELRCDGCEARLEYTLASEPLECRSDDDCSGGWLCSQGDGRCVECLNDGDCAEDQTCASTSRRCTPDSPAGCAHPGGGPVGSGGIWLLGLVALVWLRRRRTWRPAASAAAAVVVALAATLGASTAHAETPRASFSLGVGPRLLTGDLGEVTQRGIGVSVAQELRTRYIGGMFELASSYYLTSQPAPPLSRELQVYSVSVGPKFYLPIGPIEASLGIDYRHIGLVSNSLIRTTGPQVNHAAVGGTLEVRYRVAPFDLMLRTGFHPILSLEGSVVSIDLAVGLSAGE